MARFTDKEQSLLQTVFKGQESLFILIRKFFLQAEMKPDEVKYLKSICTSEVIDLFYKILGIHLNFETSIGNINDIYSGVDLNPTPYDHALLQIKSLHKRRKYLTQRLEALAGKKVEGEIKFDALLDDTGTDEDYINFITRNGLLKDVEIQFIMQLQILSGTISAEEMLEKMKKNSTK